jgi:hypothetical protein
MSTGGSYAVDDFSCSSNYVDSGFQLHIGGGLIHFLPVVGLVVLLINRLGGRGSAVCRRAVRFPAPAGSLRKYS